MRLLLDCQPICLGCRDYRGGGGSGRDHYDDRRRDVSVLNIFIRYYLGTYVSYTRVRLVAIYGAWWLLCIKAVVSRHKYGLLHVVLRLSCNCMRLL